MRVGEGSTVDCDCESGFSGLGIGGEVGEGREIKGFHDYVVEGSGH